MIQQGNPHQSSCFLDSFGDIDISAAGFDFTAWVVVEGDDCAGVVHQGGFEDLPGFDVEIVQGTDGNDMESGEFTFGVKRDDAKPFIG